VTRDEELITILGYLHGDVVKAFRNAIEWGRADPANVSAALDAIEAATRSSRTTIRRSGSWAGGGLSYLRDAPPARNQATHTAQCMFWPSPAGLTI